MIFKKDQQTDELYLLNFDPTGVQAHGLRGMLLTFNYNFDSIMYLYRKMQVHPPE